MVVDLDDLVVARADLAPHAQAAARAQLQLGHAHDVVEGHPQREPACGLARRRMAVRSRRIAGTLGVQHALQACRVERRIGVVLVLGDARMAEREQLVDAARKAQLAGRRSTPARWRGAAGVDCIASGTRPRRARRSLSASNASAKPRRLASTPLPARRIVSSYARAEKATRRCRERAEHHRADRACPPRARAPPCRALRRRAHARAALPSSASSVDAAVAELHLLHHRQRARGRADHGGALGARHAEADLPHRLEQLRRQQHVDRAGHRVQAEHRAPPAELDIGARHRARRSTWSRRCAARRPGSTCTARCDRRPPRSRTAIR